jgi:hypothetical protein
MKFDVIELFMKPIKTGLSPYDLFALYVATQRGTRKDQQKTTAQQLVASIHQHSTVSCRHWRINHTDQSR